MNSYGEQQSLDLADLATDIEIPAVGAILPVSDGDNVTWFNVADHDGETLISIEGRKAIYKNHDWYLVSDNGQETVAKPVYDYRRLGEQLHRWGANVTAIRPNSKHPITSWKELQERCQTEAELAALPWAMAGGVGIVNGSGSFRCIDIDAKKGRTVPVEYKNAWLAALGLPLDYPWCYRSGSGRGWHIWTKGPAGDIDGVLTVIPVKVPEVDHIEFRWTTGQTVMSVDSVPSEPPAEVPIETVYNALKALTLPKDSNDSKQQGTIPESQKSGANGQSVTIPQTTGAYGQAALEDAAQRVINAPEGGRNNTLFTCAAALSELENGGEIPPGAIEEALFPAALSAGLTEKEARATIESARKASEGKARTAPETGASFSANGQQPAGQVGDIAIPKPISGADFAARRFEPLQFLIALLIAKGHFVLLAGRPKGGKSWLALTMAMCVDLGLSFLGKTTKAARVLYIALEDGQRRMNARMAALKWLPRRADFLFNIAQFDGPGGTLGPGLQQLAELAKGYDLIVIDTLIRTLSGRVDENNNTQMGAIANEIASIAHDTNTAIIVIHHTGKGQADDRFEKLRGASSIRGAYDVGLILERQQGEREAVLGAESRDLEIEDMTLRQAANGAGWEYLGPGFQIESIRAGRKTLEAMLTHPTYLDGLTAADIAEVRGVSERAAQQQLLSLELGGYVVRESPKSTAMGRRPDIWHVSDEYKG